jgi:hypothetical protein
MDDEIRELLRRKADEVPAHPAVPRSLTRRVRYRIARNAVAGAMALAVLGAGGFASVRALNAPGDAAPIGPVSTPTTQPTPSASPTPSGSPTPPAGATACTSAQLRAVATMQGAAGSREGTVELTNLSQETCTLQGTPAITLLGHNGKPRTNGVTFSSAPAGWEVEGSAQPSGWPVVTLQAGDSASVRIRWSNWCPGGRAAPVWRIEIPSGGTVDVRGMDSTEPPPCNGPGQPSTIEVAPFEPGGA